MATSCAKEPEGPAEAQFLVCIIDCVYPPKPLPARETRDAKPGSDVVSQNIDLIIALRYKHK